MTTRGQNAGAVLDTDNDIQLKSTNGSIVFDGTAEAGHGASGLLSRGGRIIFTAKGSVTVKGTLKGGNGGRGVDLSEASKPGLGGGIYLMGDRIVNEGALVGGKGGNKGNNVVNTPGGEGGWIVMESTGGPDPDDLNSGLIKMGDCTAGLGGSKFVNSAWVVTGKSGCVKATAAQAGTITSPAGKKLKGRQVILDSRGGVIKMASMGPGAIEAEVSVCLNAGPNGAVLLNGAASGSIVAQGEVNIFGPVDVSQSQLSLIASPAPNLTVTPCSRCLGDLNDDGFVDTTDLAMLLTAFGPCGSECPADLNGDGFVNGIDMSMLLESFGECSDFDAP